MKFDLFELIYVDKNYNTVPADLKQLGTWQFKHRYIAPIAFGLVIIPLLLIAGILCLFLAPIKFVLDYFGFTDRCG